MAKKTKQTKTSTSKKPVTAKPKPVVEQPSSEAHVWRACPYGEHQVRTHPLSIPPSKTHPKGLVVPRGWHCAKNPSGKDELYPAEIQEISRKRFLRLKKGPCPSNLGFREKEDGQRSGNAFDPLVTGWVKYWNEVLKPDIPLTPNLVKP